MSGRAEGYQATMTNAHGCGHSVALYRPRSRVGLFRVGGHRLRLESPLLWERCCAQVATGRSRCGINSESSCWLERLVGETERVTKEVRPNVCGLLRHYGFDALSSKGRSCCPYYSIEQFQTNVYSMGYQSFMSVFPYIILSNDAVSDSSFVSTCRVFSSHG